MSESPTKREVDKLIRNLLSAGHPVSMPGVGTLAAVRQGARRLPGKRIAPPSLQIEFSSHEQDPSLVDAILRAASCTPEQARDIYERWLGKSREGETLIIGGVGRLVQKSFTVDASFDAVLNPLGHEPVRVKRRCDGWLWALAGVAVCVAAVCALAVGGVIGDPFHSAVKNEQSVTEKPALLLSETVVEPLPETVLDSVTAIAAAVPAESQEAAVETTPEERLEPFGQNGSDEVGPTQQGCNYVVLGIFSTDQNARRAVAQAEAKDASLKCRIYRYGEKYLVSLFESAEAESAQEFARAHRETFRDLWVYTKR